MLSRRQMIHGIAASSAMLGTPNNLLAASRSNSKTKRIIFFLQNQGFDPLTCIPAKIKTSCSLNDFKLQEPMKDLEPYKDRMHIITGLHGRHTSPYHSACFGALGGYRGGIGVPPSAPTIDYTLSTLLPKAVLPHLSIGMESLPNMQGRPNLATLSAEGAGRPIFMHSDPAKLYQMIFGSVAGGAVNKRYSARSKLLQRIEKISRDNGKNLPFLEAKRYAEYVHGFKYMNELREKLSMVSGQLKKFAPKPDDRYIKPKFETDWHDALLEIGISVLQANITNVLTIGSGRGEIYGSWKGLGVVEEGHTLGHMKQPDNPIWIKIRQYNCRMLVKIIKSLEAIPEGKGNMMDNTLIVYTSNNGNQQHTTGTDWPFLFIGNGGGQFKTGLHTNIKDRPLNDLYTTLLHGIGAPVDRYNMNNTMATLYNSKPGPIKELLV